MATYRQQLEEINTVISSIIAGEIQSYKFAGREVTKFSIDVLFKERSRLEPLAARERQTGGGIRQRAGYMVR